MSMENLSVRRLIDAKKLRYKEIAAAMDIAPEYLSRLMRYQLTQTMRVRVLAAIDSLLAGRGGAER